MKLILLLAGLLTICHSSWSQAGLFDRSFGREGLVRTDFPAYGNVYGSYSEQILPSPDGKIYVVFHIQGQVMITRRLADGGVDRTYGKEGYSIPVYMNPAKGVLQQDGKIIVNYVNGTSVVL